MAEYWRMLQTCRNISGEPETIQDVVFARRLRGIALERVSHCQLGLQDEVSTITFKNEIPCVSNSSVMTLILGVYPTIRSTCLSVVLGTVHTLPNSPGLAIPSVCFDKENITHVTHQDLECNYTTHFTAFTFKPNLNRTDSVKPLQTEGPPGENSSKAESRECGTGKGNSCEAADCHFSWSSFMFGLVLGITVTTTIAVVARRRAKSFSTTSYKLSEFEGSELTLTMDDQQHSSSSSAYSTMPARQRREPFPSLCLLLLHLVLQLYLLAWRPR